MRILRPLIVACLALIAIPIVGGLLSQRDYYLDLAILTVIFALAGCAWNIVGGYQNQLALGHSAYFAIGAYVSTLLFIRQGLSPWIGIWVGFITAGLAAAALAGLVIRLRTAFYALATVAFSEVVRILLTTQGDLTGGSRGLSIPYRPSFGNFVFSDRQTYFVIFGVALVICVLLTAFLEQSRSGLQSRALSLNEEAAASLGVRLFRLKIAAAFLSGGLTAIAGSFYAQYILYLTPDRLAGLDLSIEIPLIAVLGGVARSWGPVLGAAILIPGTALLRSFLAASGFGASAPAATGMVYGLVLVVVLLVAPYGIAEAISRLRVGAVQSMRRRGLRAQG